MQRYRCLGITFVSYVSLSHGLSELWIKCENGDSSRFIPLYFLISGLGPMVCSVIIKAHILTGCDITSKIGKIGTKLSVLNCKPQRFGDIDDILS